MHSFPIILLFVLFRLKIQILFYVTNYFFFINKFSL